MHAIVSLHLLVLTQDFPLHFLLSPLLRLSRLPCHLHSLSSTSYTFSKVSDLATSFCHCCAQKHHQHQLRNSAASAIVCGAPDAERADDTDKNSLEGFQCSLHIGMVNHGVQAQHMNKEL